MPKKKNADALAELERRFEFPDARRRAMIEAFHGEMGRGLAGASSSLQMLPTYTDIPTGLERGTFLALDMGGTNVRILRVDLRGGGSAPSSISRKFRLNRDKVGADGETLFGAVARFVGAFLADRGLRGKYRMGFTFSFATRQRSIARGELIAWTKGWTAQGVVGRDVVELLNRSLAREGLDGARVVSLNNDTTGTHMARAYLDPACDAACILGTGTNVCYRERVSRIGKPIGPYRRESMIINMESGNFDQALLRTPFDALLDDGSENPGAQAAEKMVSGKYLGELVRLVVADFCGRGLLFGGRLPDVFASAGGFGSERVCEIKEDGVPGAGSVCALLSHLGVEDVAAEDARTIREIAWIVSDRAARIAASILAATVTKNDPALEQNHTIAVDGSVFEKHPGFRARMEETFRELFGDGAARIRLELTPDGSGLGAAIIAAVASAEDADPKE